MTCFLSSSTFFFELVAFIIISARAYIIVCIKNLHSLQAGWDLVTLRWRNLKTDQSPVILDLCLRKTRSGKSRDYHDVIVFKKLRFQNVFRLHLNATPVFSNSSKLKSFFKKAPFSWRISVDGRPNRRNKAAFSNFSGIVWTRLVWVLRVFIIINQLCYPSELCHWCRNYCLV